MITTYLSVALILAVILLIRRPFARAFGAKAAYALWALPLLRLAMPPLPSWMSPSSMLPSTTTAPTPSMASARAAQTFTSESGAVLAPPPSPLPVVEAVSEPIIAGQTNLLALPSWNTALTVLITVALAGAAVLIARQLYAQWQFAWLIKTDSDEASDAIAEMSDAVRREVGLRRRVPVRSSFLCGAPLVTGVLRPVVLVPAWFELDYSCDEQRIALTHEFMHVKRGDLLALQLAHAVAAIQWLNPFAWRCLDAFRADQEAACDADVLGLRTASPRAYGATLLKAIRQSRPTPPPAFVAALPLNHAIKERFALLDRRENSPIRSRAGLAVTLIGGTALMLFTAGTVSAEQELDGGSDESSRSFSWSSNMEDRKLVILGDPMVEFNHKMSKLDTLEWPEPPTPPVPPLPPRFDEELQVMLSELEDLTAVHHLTVLGHASNIAAAGIDLEKLSADSIESVFIMRDGEVDTTVLELRIEAMVEEIERHAGDIERSAEAWAESFELDAERFEAHAEEMAAMAEAYIGSPDMQMAMERGVEAIETLNDGCQDAEFTRSRVIEVLEADNGTVAICVDGQAKRSVVEDAVRDHAGLSRTQKEAFFDRHNQHIHIQVGHHSDDNVHIRIDGAQGHTQSYSFETRTEMDEDCEDDTHAHLDDEDCDELE